MRIFCAVSPLTFKPIVQLIEAVGYRPQSVYEQLCLCLIDPLNPKYTPFKEASHLTDAQTKQEQIRYLNVLEIDRKLVFIAKILTAHMKKQTLNSLTFVIHPHYQGLTHLSKFIKYLQAYSFPHLSIQFSQEAKSAVYSCEESKAVEELYFADEIRKTRKAEALLEAAKNCSNAGDYYSAIHLLVALKDLSITDKWLETEIYLHLALCYRLTEEIIHAEFYYNLCLKSVDFCQRNSAFYALGMIYLRHHAPKYLETSRGAQYLEEAYQLLLKEPEDERIRVDRVFNRNGLALAKFRAGEVGSAQGLVTEGLKRLQDVNTHYSKFHQTVLHYNLFQCLIAQQAHDEAVKCMEHLISLDPKFFLYHEALAELYVNIECLEEATDTLLRAIEIDGTYFKFYYLMGKIRFLQKDHALAMRQFKQALIYSPSSMASLCYLTTIYNLEEQYKDTTKLLAHFDLKYHNNVVGELIFNNQLVALLNTSATPEVIQKLVGDAYTIRPNSPLIKALSQQFGNVQCLPSKPPVLTSTDREN